MDKFSIGVFFLKLRRNVIKSRLSFSKYLIADNAGLPIYIRIVLPPSGKRKMPLRKSNFSANLEYKVHTVSLLCTIMSALEYTLKTNHISEITSVSEFFDGFIV